MRQKLGHMTSEAMRLYKTAASALGCLYWITHCGRAQLPCHVDSLGEAHMARS